MKNEKITEDEISNSSRGISYTGGFDERYIIKVLTNMNYRELTRHDFPQKRAFNYHAGGLVIGGRFIQINDDPFPLVREIACSGKNPTERKLFLSKLEEEIRKNYLLKSKNPKQDI